MKEKVVDIQILGDGDELVSSVCHGSTITLTIKHPDGSYQIFMIEKNDADLFKIVSGYKLRVSRMEKIPLIKTSSSDDGKEPKGGLRAYTI